MKTLGDLHMKPDSATAIVELTVEVRIGAWGADCTIQQAISQATEEATNRLNRLLGEDKSVRVLRAAAVRVVCDAKKE